MEAKEKRVELIELFYELIYVYAISCILPGILELWGVNLFTDVDSKNTTIQQLRNDNSAFSPPVRGDRDHYP